MGQAEPDLVPESDDAEAMPAVSGVSPRTGAGPVPLTEDDGAPATEDRRLAMPAIVPSRDGHGDGKRKSAPDLDLALEDLQRINTREGLV